jgi:hypothetical protein
MVCIVGGQLPVISDWGLSHFCGLAGLADGWWFAVVEVGLG